MVVLKSRPRRRTHLLIGGRRSWVCSAPALRIAQSARRAPRQDHEIESPTRIKVLDLDAFDGTPILDVKPVLHGLREG